jgi:hypothetical protein
MGLLDRKISDAIAKIINTLTKIHSCWLNIKAAAIALLTPKIAGL